MNRQCFFRVLLSLVLLFSQQMATAHAFEHLVGALGTAHALARVVDSDEASELAKAVAQHQSCHQCLAFAQLAGPLGSSACSVAPLELVVHGALRATPTLLHSSTIFARQPRGPPQD